MTRIHMMATMLVVAVGAFACSSDPAAPEPTKGTAKGSVTLTVRINGSVANNACDETASMSSTANYRIDLPAAEVTTQSGERMVTWDDERLVGTMFWTDDRQRAYECNSVLVTDRTLITRSASPSVADGQIAGGTLIIDAAGGYKFVVSATPVGTPGREVTERWFNCPSPGNDRTETGLPVPFLQYFFPMDPAMMGQYSGTAISSDSTRVNGSYSGKDSIVVFSSGTNVKTIPVDYTVQWSITLPK